MKHKKPVMIAGVTVVAVAGWALFRPELLFIDRHVNEAFSELSTANAAPRSVRSLAQGQFQGIAHPTSGSASIHAMEDGKRMLRLTDFETSNGPALHVYLVAASDASDNAAVTRAGFIDLGPLKGNKGNQGYELPASFDLERHRAVTIWCSRFGVNFGTAPLAVSR